MKPEDRETVNRIYANGGKAIAAFERQILPQPAPFDKYVDAVINDHETAKQPMQQDAVEGLKFFIGRAKCIDCHIRPLLSNSSFPDIGLNNPKHRERAEGIDMVLSDEFNCLGRYSDAKPEECLELRFIDTNKSKYAGAFKTPTLRNVAGRPPYMHAGQIKTLFEALSFYRRSGSDELEHQELSNTELSQIEAFLKTRAGR